VIRVVVKRGSGKVAADKVPAPEPPSAQPEARLAAPELKPVPATIFAPMVYRFQGEVIALQRRIDGKLASLHGRIAKLELLVASLAR
jgi:hypothetical protein